MPVEGAISPSFRSRSREEEEDSGRSRRIWSPGGRTVGP